MEDEGKDRLVNVSFHKARFLGNVTFKDHRFEGFVNFSQTQFNQPPTFENCDGMERMDVTGARFGFTGSRPKYLPKLLWWIDPNWTRNSNIPTRLRILRKQMDDIKAHDAERDLFIAERMAERGVLWNAAWTEKKPFKALVMGSKALGATGLLFFFWLLSNYGRSAKLPAFWFAAKLTGFYYAYRAFVEEKPSHLPDDIFSFTLGHSLPFATSLSPVQKAVMERLFPAGDGKSIDMPLSIELLSIGQSLIGALLLFLFLQAVRNHFRLR